MACFASVSLRPCKSLKQYVKQQLTRAKHETYFIYCNTASLVKHTGILYSLSDTLPHISAFGFAFITLPGHIHLHGGHYSAFNIRIGLFLTLGNLTYGYAFSVVFNTFGQPGFLQYFNLADNPSYTNKIEGSISGLFSAGCILGALAVGYIYDKHGRKITMNTAALICIIGGALQAGSINVAMLLEARFITGCGIGMMVVLIPIFQAENSPPSSRGLLVGQHGAWIVFGYAIASWVGIGTFYSSNLSFQWRFPLALQCVFPLGLFCCSPWVPESPRWLLVQGRHAESWDIISRLRVDGNIVEANKISYAQEEFHQMVKQVEMDSHAWIAGGGAHQMYSKASYRKRMMIGLFTQYSAQATGAMHTDQRGTHYMVNLYNDLGFNGGLILILGALYVTVAMMANFLASFVMDFVGRVRLLIIGMIGCMVTLECAMEAEYMGTNNLVGNSLGMFFIFCFIFFYAGGIDATSYVYYSEIFPTHIRSQGMTFSIIGTFLSTVYCYVMFICLTAVHVTILWRHFPKTKGLSLEEINMRFGDEVAAHFSEAGYDDSSRKYESNATEMKEGI
ncbi:general substrate transporter [Suillus weaverae]|nr:general substrate transporter [Suillus weaverae]